MNITPLLVFSAVVGAAQPPARDEAVSTPFCTEANFRILEVTLPNMIMRDLLDSSSVVGKESGEFLRDHPDIPFYIAFPDNTPGDHGKRPTSYDNRMAMEYSHRPEQFNINHVLLHTNGKDESRLVQDPETLKQMIKELSDAAVHEISHAREARAMGFFVPPIFEDELVAYYRGMAYLMDRLQKDPDYNRLRESLKLQISVHEKFARFNAVKAELQSIRQNPGNRNGRQQRLAEESNRLESDLFRIAKDYKSLINDLRLSSLFYLNELRKSDAAFEERLRKSEYLQRKIPSLFDDPGQIAAEMRKSAAQFEDGLLREQKILEGSNPGSEEATQTSNFIKEVKDAIPTFKISADFWSDKDKVEKTRAHYLPLLSELRADMDRRRKNQAALFRSLTAPENALTVQYDLNFK